MGTDVTEFKQPWGKAYFAPVYDFGSKEIVAWSTSLHPDMAQQHELLDQLMSKKPDGAGPILHSDMGWQYQQAGWCNRLENAGVTQSMSRKGNCIDNGATEQVFGHLKDEFHAGRDKTMQGVVYDPNMPTEEVFTAPLREGIDGVVYSAMPLVHNGNIIENFHFVIKDGRIVDVHAEKGEDILRAAIAEDEGASYFGEVALVPYDSPISNQKILFYNTLFDENAACHLAFGEAYPECVEGGEAMSKEERKAAGLNDSNTHVDFMIGTSDLSIIGTTKDGREVPVFVNGSFAL